MQKTELLTLDTGAVIRYKKKTNWMTKKLAGQPKIHEVGTAWEFIAIPVFVAKYEHMNYVDTVIINSWDQVEIVKAGA